MAINACLNYKDELPPTSYFFVEDWTARKTGSGQDAYADAFFPVLFSYFLHTNIFTGKKGFVVFDNNTIRKTFQRLFSKTVLANNGIPETNLCMPDPERKRISWIFPSIVREEDSENDDEKFSYVDLDLKRRTLRTHGAGDYFQVPLCRLTESGISPIEGFFDSPPEFVILFLERDRLSSSMEYWQRFFSNFPKISIVVVVKNVNQLPSPNILRNRKTFIHSNMDLDRISGRIKKRILHEFDDLTNVNDFNTLKKALLELHRYSFQSYRVLFSLLSGVCNDLEKYGVKIAGNERVSLQSLPNPQYEQTLDAVSSLDNSFLSIEENPKIAIRNDNMNRVVDLDAFGYHERGEDLFDAGSGAKDVKILGVPKIFDNSSIKLLKRINYFDGDVEILLAGKMEEVLFDLLFMNEQFYQSLFSERKSGIFDDVDIDRAAKGTMGLQLPSGDAIESIVFSEYAEMNKFVREIRKNLHTGLEIGFVDCVCLNLKDEFGKRLNLFLPVNSNHSLFIKRSGKKMSVKPLKIVPGDVLEQGTWNNVVLLQAIKDNILNDPEYSDLLKEKLAYYVSLSEIFRRKLEESDIEKLAGISREKGHSISDVTIHNWIDITMNPISHDSLKIVAGELGFANRQIEELFTALQAIKKLRNQPPLNGLLGKEMVRLTVQAVESIKTKVDYIGRLQKVS